MNDSEHGGSEMWYLHYRHASNDCDIVVTPTGMSPRENDLHDCVFDFCTAEADLLNSLDYMLSKDIFLAPT